MITILNPYDAKDLKEQCSEVQCDRPAIYIASDVHRPRLMGEATFRIYICRYNEYLGKNHGGE